MPNVKRVANNLKHLTRIIKEEQKSLEEDQLQQQPEMETRYEEAPLTPAEKWLNFLSKIMWGCTGIVALEVVIILMCPSVFDFTYENLHAKDFSEAEVFLSNRHPELVPFLKIAKDSNGKCKTGQTLRSCYLFLNEDAEILKDLTYGAKQKPES